MTRRSVALAIAILALIGACDRVIDLSRRGGPDGGAGTDTGPGPDGGTPDDGGPTDGGGGLPD
ncbi:MAG: hypothetical protein JNL83_37805 [Myxococcales bacterium]|nr:hypothetical protein [Myxococcales bacterium]